jgi:hypothetical protein
MMKTNYTFPNLIIPGAGKSGTSSLHRYLNQHPNIYMSEKKEPAYFFRDDLYQKEIEWYSSLFEPGMDKKYRGESSTYYFKYLPAIERMKKDLADPKFIILLRHPVQKVISHYFWLKGKGLEYRPFRKAVVSDLDEPFRPGYHIRRHHKHYLDNSFYYKWIKQYFEYFGQDNFLVITNEKMNVEPLETLNRCFSFLGLDPLDHLDITRHNVTIHKGVPKLDAMILNILFMENDRKPFYKIRNAIVPEFVKNNYWKVHNKWTEKRLLEIKPILSDEDYDWFLSFLTEDIKKLKKLLQNNFDEWEDLREIQ